MTSYKDSRIWQSAMQLAITIYSLTTGLPAVERLDLSTNLQRAAAAIPTHLASGSLSRSQLIVGCQAAQSAAAELETLLLITGQAYPDIATDGTLDQLDDVQMQLSALSKRLSGESGPPKTKIL